MPLTPLHIQWRGLDISRTSPLSSFPRECIKTRRQLTTQWPMMTRLFFSVVVVVVVRQAKRMSQVDYNLRAGAAWSRAPAICEPIIRGMMACVVVARSLPDDDLGDGSLHPLLEESSEEPRVIPWCCFVVDVCHWMGITDIKRNSRCDRG